MIGWEILGVGNVVTVEMVTGWDVSRWSTAGVHEKEEKEEREKAMRATWEKKSDQHRSNSTARPELTKRQRTSNEQWRRPWMYMPKRGESV